MASKDGAAATDTAATGSAITVLGTSTAGTLVRVTRFGAAVLRRAGAAAAGVDTTTLFSETCFLAIVYTFCFDVLTASTAIY